MIIVTLVGLFFALLWIGFLTWKFRRLERNYSILTNGVNRKTLDVVLTNMVKEIQESKKDIVKLTEGYATIEKNEQFHIQKIGLLRFNPFKDTGGDQSFILTLIDAHHTGVVITALYSRSGTRWYAKRVVKGKGIEHELSEEEQKALKVANDSQ